MTRPKAYALLTAAAVAALLGCGRTAVSPSTSAKAAAPPPPPKIDLQKVQPNELGRVLILEYHNFGPKEARWTRTPENFRKDLDRLYKLGYRLVSMNDLIDNHIAIPPGTSPVVLTFDDASRGQFGFVEQGRKQVPDPNTAVGILVEFHRKHPDFGQTGTFYALYPAFGVPSQSEAKLRYLVSHGFEVGNHTWNHDSLRKLSDDAARKELALPAKEIARIVPGYRIRSIALPYGEKPRNPAVLESGSFQGITYRNEAALLVGAEPAPSPNSREFQPMALPRVQGIQSELDMWLANLSKPGRRYISDGDPNTITVPKAEATEVVLHGKKLRTY